MLEKQIVFPPQFSREVCLLDGSKITIRPLCYKDKGMVHSLMHRVTSDTLFLRYHYVKNNISEEEVDAYCSIDYCSTYILVAEKNCVDRVEIIGLAQYDVLRDKTMAEVSFMVDDREQGKGIATHMLNDLAKLAKEQGIRIFIGELMTSNAMMLDILRKYRPNLRQSMDGHTITVTFVI